MKTSVLFIFLSLLICISCVNDALFFEKGETSAPAENPFPQYLERVSHVNENNTFLDFFLQQTDQLKIAQEELLLDNVRLMKFKGEKVGLIIPMWRDSHEASKSLLVFIFESEIQKDQIQIFSEGKQQVFGDSTYQKNTITNYDGSRIVEQEFINGKYISKTSYRN